MKNKILDNEAPVGEVAELESDIEPLWIIFIHQETFGTVLLILPIIKYIITY